MAGTRRHSSDGLWKLGALLAGFSLLGLCWQLQTLQHVVTRLSAEAAELREEVRQLQTRLDERRESNPVGESRLEIAADPIWISNDLTLRPVVEERCEQIELNRVGCRQDGKTRLLQLIFWGPTRELLIDPPPVHALLPPGEPQRRHLPVVHDFAVLGGRPWTAYRTPEGVTILKHRGAMLYKVRAPLWLATATWHDPELDNRNVLPLERRRRLRD